MKPSFSRALGFANSTFANTKVAKQAFGKNKTRSVLPVGREQRGFCAAKPSERVQTKKSKKEVPSGTSFNTIKIKFANEAASRFLANGVDWGSTAPRFEVFKTNPQ